VVSLSLSVIDFSPCLFPCRCRRMSRRQ